MTSLCRLSELVIISGYEDGIIMIRSLPDSASSFAVHEGGVHLEHINNKAVKACSRLNDLELVSLSINHRLVLLRKDRRWSLAWTDLNENFRTG